MQQRLQSRRFRGRTRVASLLLAVLLLDLIALTSSLPLLPSHRFEGTFVGAIEEKTLLVALEKRAPAPPVSAPVAPTSASTEQATTTEEPPKTATTVDPPPTATTTEPPVTTTDPPVTTTTTTTTTTTAKPTTTTAETHPTTTSSSSEPEPTETSTRTSATGRQTTGRPTGTGGPVNPPSSPTTTNSTSPPTATPTNGEKSSKPPVLPIVLGTVLGLGALIGAGVFFFFRFRKHRRFDSKRPLSFLALSLEDPAGGAEAGSSRAAGTDAIYDANRPITSQPSLRYTPPAMAGVLGNSRFSYQTSSDRSSSTVGQFAQWSQDDENAALVGGPSRQQQIMMTEHGQDGYSDGRFNGGLHAQEHDLLSDDNGLQQRRPDSEQSFIATSMFPLAPNDPRRARYSRQQNQPQGVAQEQEAITARDMGDPQQISPTLPKESVPLRALNSNRPQEGPGSPLSRPLSIHSNAASVLSVKNPTEVPGRQPSVRSTRSVGGASSGEPGKEGPTSRPSGEGLQYL
ncbi:hypothetical protein BC939DRAFT_453909 [Gamsiella multidivaricata]|uniref:uncharacterized protein n=1 Tax=Gamsiella multidivaricata TaxID=101098 RepID=UPI002220D5FA|nr:uncharacterized protein BC939DRAFT_453909 [Gamsiella multidivaricata]KAG0362884.1 hypothetical protein BGZ54_008454 [Gamsiella multidivaricata]KAI7822361.1 hypothetical protein BC939DRAFT_453909 [Gamsiella multidivaricata]